MNGKELCCLSDMDFTNREAAAERCPALQSAVLHPRHAGATTARLPRHRRRPHTSTAPPAATAVHRRLQPLVGQRNDAGRSNVRVVGRRRALVGVVDGAASVEAPGKGRARRHARDSARSPLRQHRHARISRSRSKCRFTCVCSDPGFEPCNE